MVVLPDKTDYGSFGEPSSSGVVITAGVGSTSARSVTPSSGNLHSSLNSNSSRHSSVSSNNSNIRLSSSGPGTGKSVFGTSDQVVVVNGSQVSFDNGNKKPSNSNVSIGLNLDLSSSNPKKKTLSSSSIEARRSVDETGNKGARNHSSSSNTRYRNSSGNNNTQSAGHSPSSSSAVPNNNLPQTDTIVVITSHGGGKSSNSNGTSTQPYSSSSSPMSTNSGDLLYQRQPLLQECENGWVDNDAENRHHVGTSTSPDGGKRGRGSAVRIDIPPSSDQSVVTLKRYPKEKKKTVIAFLILCCNFVLATLSLAFTHDHVPEGPNGTRIPLPDVILDNVTVQDWALQVSDVLVALSTAACAVVMLLHRHRWIVLRRCFLILACLYLMRSVTMRVTVLPVASKTYYCSPKSNSTSVLEVIRRVVQLVSGFGLSINGKHTYCGDYIYSGHTVILCVAYLFIQEYTPRKLYYVHWASWITSCLGIVFMSISRGHYTVDILIAYYAATRLFWIYHTLANNPHLKVYNGQNGITTNYLSRIWWFPLFRYMEGNVGGPLPRHYSYPWSSRDHRGRRNI